MLKIRLKSSKTDPFREGCDVFVGRTDFPLCPVAAMLAYLSYRCSSPSPLFKFSDGKPLTHSNFVEAVRKALDTAGIDSSQYSFRSGAATTAAKQGIGDATIMMLGDWRSNAYQRYIRTPREQVAAFLWVLSSKQEGSPN